MKLTILGCGTSTGVPRIGGDWGRCDPTEPKNRRTRSSIVVEHDGFRILIDTGPDMHAQLIAASIGRIDAVIWTHDHADHCHGIDDLRQLGFLLGGPVPAYGSAVTLANLKARFAYVFEGNGGYPATADAREIDADMRVGPFRVHTTEQPHGPVTSTGLRIDAGGASLGYAIDFHDITEEMVALYRGVDMLVTDCLRYQPHPTHADLDTALDLVARSATKSALLTHMDKSMDYRTLCDTLPEGVAPAHDGLEIEF